jgi:Zn-dependent protease with chaperone function
LPAVGADEIKAAGSIIAQAAPLTASQRPPAEDAAMLGRATSRLVTAAGPLCTAYLDRACSFEVVFDASAVGVGTMSAEASGRGRVTVSAGMLRVLDTEDEVAAVVAHELSHHLAGHIARSWARGSVAGAAAGAVVGALIPFGGLAGWVVGQGAAELGAGAARLAYSKQDEREADYLAAYLLARAGYDLERAGRIWVRLARPSNSGETAGLLEAHPSDAERLAVWWRTSEEIRTSPGLVPRLSSGR